MNLLAVRSPFDLNEMINSVRESHEEDSQRWHSLELNKRKKDFPFLHRNSFRQRQQTSEKETGEEDKEAKREEKHFPTEYCLLSSVPSASSTSPPSRSETPNVSNYLFVFLAVNIVVLMIVICVDDVGGIVTVVYLIFKVHVLPCTLSLNTISFKYTICLNNSLSFSFPPRFAVPFHLSNLNDAFPFVVDCRYALHEM